MLKWLANSLRSSRLLMRVGALNHTIDASTIPERARILLWAQDFRKNCLVEGVDELFDSPTSYSKDILIPLVSKFEAIRLSFVRQRIHAKNSFQDMPESLEKLSTTQIAAVELWISVLACGLNSAVIDKVHYIWDRLETPDELVLSEIEKEQTQAALAAKLGMGEEGVSHFSSTEQALEMCKYVPAFIAAKRK